jgi:hypothetical protein
MIFITSKLQPLLLVVMFLIIHASVNGRNFPGSALVENATPLLFY